MQFFGVVGFGSSALTVFTLAPDLFTNNWKHIQACVSFVDLVIYHDFRDLNKFHPLFGLESKIITLRQKFQENVFIGHCSFTQLVHDVKKLRRKPQIFVKVIQKFWYVQHVCIIFYKNPQEAVKVANFVKFFIVKNKPRHVTILNNFGLDISSSKSKTTTTSVCPLGR